MDLGTIKKRTQGDVTSVEDEVIEAIKGYNLTYDNLLLAITFVTS